MRKIVISGNCQMAVIVASLQLIFPKDKVVALNYISDPQGDKLDEYQSQLSDADIWLVISKDWALKVYEKLNLNELNIISFPNLEFRGFHPDQSYILEPNSNNVNPVYQSSLIACGFKMGLTQDEIFSCFNEKVFDDLGYHESWNKSLAAFKWRFDTSDMRSYYIDYIRFCQRRWRFMHTINHPHVECIIWLAKLISLKLGASRNVLDMEIILHDFLTSVIWPIYPSVASSIGLSGSFTFILGNKSLSLGDFINVNYIKLREKYADRGHIVSAPYFIELNVVEKTIASFLKG